MEASKCVCAIRNVYPVRNDMRQNLTENQLKGNF